MGNSSYLRFDDDNKTKYIYSLNHTAAYIVVMCANDISDLVSMSKIHFDYQLNNNFHVVMTASTYWCCILIHCLSHFPFQIVFFCTKCSVPAFSVDVVILRNQYNKISHLNFEWPNTAHSIIQIHFSSWYQPSVTLILPLCRAHVRSDIFRTKTSIKFIDSHSTSWLSPDEYFDGLNCWINLVYLDL